MLHTPGHTIESVCYLIDGKAILTGDTLFLGDVGRPDLAQGTDSHMTKEKMASLMFSSVKRLKQLDDSVVVLTGHGSGSPCGKNILGGTHCTIGGQKKSNYALADDMTEEKMVAALCANLAPPQNWFGRAVELNLKGYTPSEEVNSRVALININQAVDMAKKDSRVRLVDCRTRAKVLETGFVLGSYGLYADGSVA